ncbi:MAG: glycosyltransferase family 9 protein [Candidatus Omnitrophica bacterium]|nr:glycosyltransferase family 9 protein [Candidatus Omnitrophota bacterium]
MKIRDKEKIKRILFITLSNIGDIILTTPVLSVLKKEFPLASIDVMSGAKGAEIFSGHPLAARYIRYDKSLKTGLKWGLIRELRKRKYDLIVDLRNSLFPLLIGSRYRTSLLKNTPRTIVHKKERHLWKLKGLGLDTSDSPFAFHVGAEDEKFIENRLAELNVRRPFAVITPGAKSDLKRWTKEGFAALCEMISNELGLDVVMAGDREDTEIINSIKKICRAKVFDLSGKLNLRQFGALVKRSRLLVTNDSAPMHIGHALKARAIAAFFGPTDPKKYGPDEANSVIIRKDLNCSPCEVAQCVRKNHECMRLINADEVFETVKKIFKKTMITAISCKN